MAQLHKLRDPSRWSLGEVVRDWHRGGYFRPLKWVDAHRRQTPHFAKWWPAPKKIDRVRMPTVSPDEVVSDVRQAKWDRNAAYFDVQAKNYSKNTTRKSMLYEHAYAEMMRRGYNDTDANRLAQLQVFQTRASQQNPLAGVRLQQDKWFRDRPLFQFIVSSAKNKKRQMRRIQATLGDVDVELVDPDQKLPVPFDLDYLTREAAAFTDLERADLLGQEKILKEISNDLLSETKTKFDTLMRARVSHRLSQDGLTFGTPEWTGVMNAKARVAAIAEHLRRERDQKHLRKEFDDLLPHETVLTAVDQEAATLASARNRNKAVTALSKLAKKKDDAVWKYAKEKRSGPRSSQRKTSTQRSSSRRNDSFDLLNL